MVSDLLTASLEHNSVHLVYRAYFRHVQVLLEPNYKITTQNRNVFHIRVATPSEWPL